MSENSEPNTKVKFNKIVEVLEYEYHNSSVDSWQANPGQIESMKKNHTNSENDDKNDLNSKNQLNDSNAEKQAKKSNDNSNSQCKSMMERIKEAKIK